MDKTISGRVKKSPRTNKGGSKRNFNTERLELPDTDARTMSPRLDSLSTEGVSEKAKQELQEQGAKAKSNYSCLEENLADLTKVNAQLAQENDRVREKIEEKIRQSEK
jgi:sugar-specific transcriptional regulator TrmB